MTKEQHEKLLADILANVDNQGALTEILDNVRNDYTETLATLETLQTTSTDLTNKNEKLREVNSALFLKVGNVADFTSTPVKPDESKQEETEMKFEDLIDKEGELI